MSVHPYAVNGNMEDRMPVFQPFQILQVLVLRSSASFSKSFESRFCFDKSVVFIRLTFLAFVFFSKFAQKSLLHQYTASVKFHISRPNCEFVIL